MSRWYGVVLQSDPAEIAQLVEHLTENQGVASSILALGTSLRPEHPLWVFNRLSPSVVVR